MMSIKAPWAVVLFGVLVTAGCSGDADSGEESLAGSTTTGSPNAAPELHDMTVRTEWTGQFSLIMSVAGPQAPSDVTTASPDAASTGGGAESQHWDDAVGGTYAISVGTRGGDACANGCDFTVTINIDGDALDTVSGTVADEEMWQHRFQCCDT